MLISSRMMTCLVLAALLGAAVPPAPAEAQAVVPVRAVRGTHMIGPDDVAIAEDTDAPGAYHDLSEVVGLEAKVTLYPGRPILKGQVGAPAIVERNQLVRMIYAEGPLNIKTEGRVLDRGGVGDTVRVMNLSSRQIVTGDIEPDGTVRVAR
jgi:flagellar basal body P-ring formation protein FlgA